MKEKPATGDERLASTSARASGRRGAISRSSIQIRDAISLLVDQLWYNHYKLYEEKIYKGQVTLRTVGIDPNTTESKALFLKALDEAKRLETRLGPENIGPWDDFEWGVINGKLSALRWVLGDEWFIDT